MAPQSPPEIVRKPQDEDIGTPVVTPLKAQAPMVTVDGTEEVLSDLEKSPKSSLRRKQADEDSARAVPNEDEDSSADDSSYFADPNHLPQPKSARYPPSSNASLSLSDDSDDHHNRVPDVYPQQLTRVHSYSSLVSTSSQPEDETYPSSFGYPMDPRSHYGMPPPHYADPYYPHPLVRNDQPSPGSKESDLAYSAESDGRREDDEEKPAFQVYWQRWLMLLVRCHR